jgi:ring-1,2-phenylacetyl-CoA epoxidase subunit PaaC
MQASLILHNHPSTDYLLRIGDTCLILAQRLCEWCGRAPILEEDIALTNIALDLLGQARAILSYVGQREPQQYTEDQLAFLRDERDYHNLTIVELPRGDFAFTLLRNFIVATFLKQIWHSLSTSTDEKLAGIAAKALKEVRYHQQHAADWVICLGQGTTESQQRLQIALQNLWPYVAEMFTDDAVDEYAVQSQLGPNWSTLKPASMADINNVFQRAQLTCPSDSPFLSQGKTGLHSEHLGHLLTEMQYLQRTFPEGVW